jgi:hypothetical protein
VPDLPKGFYAGDLYVFPMGPPASGNFGYIPAKPSIEAAGGNLKAALLSSPAAGVLSLQAVLQAPPDAVDAARQAIPDRYPEADPENIGLSPAQLDDTTGSLTVVGTNGKAQTFAPKETAGPDSYRVVFSETLTAPEKLAAIGAFRGQSGVLKVAIQGTLTLDENVAVEISGDLAEQVKALAPKPPPEEKKPGGGGFWGKKKDPDPPPPPASVPDLAACAAAVDSAIAKGGLKISIVRSPNVSDALARKVEADVRQSVAQKLLGKLKQMGADAIYLSSFSIQQKAGDSERATFQIVREADPAESLGQQAGGRLVTEAGAPIAEPNR